MSLGYNQLRRKTTTTLPGGTNSQFVPSQRRRRQTFRFDKQNMGPSESHIQDSSLLQKSSAPLLSRRVEYIEEAFKSSTGLSEQFRDSRDESIKAIQELYEQMHVVYGVADCDIYSEDDSESLVATKGSPIVLYYPMMEEGSKKLMKAKIVDPVTASLKMEKVCVFDSVSELQRRVVRFSAIPK